MQEGDREGGGQDRPEETEEERIARAIALAEDEVRREEAAEADEASRVESYMAESPLPAVSPTPVPSKSFL